MLSPSAFLSIGHSVKLSALKILLPPNLLYMRPSYRFPSAQLLTYTTVTVMNFGSVPDKIFFWILVTLYTFKLYLYHPFHTRHLAQSAGDATHIYSDCLKIIPAASARPSSHTAAPVPRHETNQNGCPAQCNCFVFSTGEETQVQVQG